MAKKNNNKKKAAAASKQPAAAATAVAGAPASEPKPETNVAEAAPAAAEATATPSDVPGGFPVTPSNEAADLEDKIVSINPLPATVPGTSNPIKLAPGEKIPEAIAAQNINEHVKLDKESYERSDALPGGPPFSTTELPPKSGTMIPESSLPMGDQADVTNATINSVGPGATTVALAGQVPLEPDATNATINSVGPGATTAALAGQVPLEPKVPQVVKESQEKAGVAPEASGVTEEVKEKAKAALASDKKDSPLEKISPEVPKEVKESIAEAGKSPEAAASTSAVEEKKEVERELLKEVRKAPAVDEVKKAPALDDAVKPAETKAPETKPTVATPAAASTQAPTTVAAANGATGAETKASEPPAATSATPATNGNGAESKPAAEGGAAHDKKKSRLSVMFSKLKAKLK
ncbi:hypothetical protein VCV18_007552 [Metarhizium anisopliae]